MTRSKKTTRKKRAGPAPRTPRPARTPRSKGPTKPAEPRPVPTIVALGSSAGGLGALTRFFGAMPPDVGMAFVIVTHLDPTHTSLMAELLGRCTTMPVIQVDGDTPVEADHVYCIPPGKYLSISRRSLRVTTPSQNHSLRMPINFFLRSLAAAPRGQVIGIILSGTGTDGTIGLREVKAAGGLAIAQDPATAEHGGMPRSAIDSGAVDHVLSPERMPDILIDCVRHLRAHDASDLAGSVQVEPNAVNELLESLHGRTTLDLRSYKRSTLERRIARRMGLKQLDRVADYARLLIDDPVEAAALTNDLLISVTSFFRDPEAWRFLQERVLRPLVAGAGAGAALRVWVPGCATGEEAYSIAMVLTEEVEAAGKSIPMQIFASDLDVGALEFARTGLYPESIAGDVPPERLRRFFVEEAHCFRVAKGLRDSVLFARQNLIADPPFPTLDLICCRNVLMYFEPGTHKHLLSLLHFALVENGHLFLGTAESTGQGEDLFEVVSQKWRIYRRLGPTRHVPAPFPTTSTLASGPRPVPSTRRSEAGQLGTLAAQLLLERFVPASVLINRNHEILYLAGPTQHYLRQPKGVPTRNLMAHLRPGLEIRLRRAIRQALHDDERTVMTDVRVRRGNAWHRVHVTAEPLDESRDLAGVLLVSFVDEPEAAAAVPDAPISLREPDEAIVRQLEDDLRSMREELHGTLEEVQSSNQELRVANEEVMSVNEELRSSNEELETSREELQSLNEELTTVNAELKDKVLQLEQANNDLDNLLTSSNIATVFLDTRFHIRRFTPTAARLFDLTPATVGQSIGDVALRCTDPDLLHDAQAVLTDLTPISKEIQDRDGRWFVRQILPYRTHDGHIQGIVLTFSDVAAEALQEARLYAEAIVDTVREPLLVLDADLNVQSANRSFYQTFQVTQETAVGRPVHELGDGQLYVPRLQALLSDVLRERGTVTKFEVEQSFATLGRRTMLLNARTLTRGGGRPDLILLAMEDITERKRAESALRESAAMTHAGVQTAIDGVITIDERATILSFNPAAGHIFGYDDSEAIGRDFGMLKVPPNGDERPAPHARYLAIGEREGRGRRKDGTIFPCDLHVSEFDDGGGRRFVVTVRDITERKRTEEQVRRQQSEMAHVLRVATIERFAAGLAHELNQPLTAIANEVEACATLVRSGKRGSRRMLALLDRAGAEALRAGDIVHHLREFVQRSEPRLEAANLCEVVRSATRWLAREMEQEHIRLRFTLATKGLPVRIDRIQIEQVFVNLLQNAVDAILEANQQREIRVRASRTASGMAEVVFEDTGAGISVAAAERLYEPFFTTKSQGMGMGLAICLTIADMHDGRLSIEPGPAGVGTSVRLLLPLEGAS